MASPMSRSRWLDSIGSRKVALTNDLIDSDSVLANPLDKSANTDNFWLDLNAVVDCTRGRRFHKNNPPWIRPQYITPDFRRVFILCAGNDFVGKNFRIRYDLTYETTNNLQRTLACYKAAGVWVCFVMWGGAQHWFNGVSKETTKNYPFKFDEHCRTCLKIASDVVGVNAVWLKDCHLQQ